MTGSFRISNKMLSLRAPFTLGPRDRTVGLCHQEGHGGDLPTASELFAHKAQTIQAPSFRLCRLSLYDSAQASITGLFIFFLFLAVGGLQEACGVTPGDRGVLSAWLGGPAQSLACHRLGPS